MTSNGNSRRGFDSEGFSSLPPLINARCRAPRVANIPASKRSSVLSPKRGQNVPVRSIHVRRPSECRRVGRRPSGWHAAIEGTNWTSHCSDGQQHRYVRTESTQRLLDRRLARVFSWAGRSFGPRWATSGREMRTLERNSSRGPGCLTQGVSVEDASYPRGFSPGGNAHVVTHPAPRHFQ